MKRARPDLERLEMRLAPAVLFNDFFDNGAFSSLNWSQNQGVTLDVFKRLNPPSPAYAARFDGSLAGGELLASTAIDLSNETGGSLSYYYERTGGGIAPAAGDDLVLEYRKPDGTWSEVDRQVVGGPAMTTFTQRTISLPQDALYQQFQFRFRTLASGGDWFIDNVNLATTTGYGNYWSDQPWYGDLIYPNNTASITFPNTAPPTGNGSLTINVQYANVGTGNNYLILSAGGHALGNVFVDVMPNRSSVQAIVQISESLLQTLAANKSIQLTISPSPGMYSSNSNLTARLEYPVGTGYVPPAVDLNGPGNAGTGFSTTFYVGSGGVAIADPTATVSATVAQPDPATQGIYSVGGASFGIYQVSPATGKSTYVAGGGPQPRGVAVDARGDLYVAEFSSPFKSTVSVLHVNALSGSVETLPNGDGLGNGMAANRKTGEIYYQNIYGGVARIDPVTGAQTPLGGASNEPGTVAVEPTGNIVEGDSNEVLRIDAHTGNTTTVSYGGLLNPLVWGTAVEASGTILAAVGNTIVQVNPTTGAQSLLTHDGNIQAAKHVIVTDTGAIYVLDGYHNLTRVDPVTGQQTPISTDVFLDPTGNFSSLVTASANPTIQSATITITNPLDGSAEVLAANTSGTAIAASYDATNALLHLTGADSPANYQKVLRTVTYNDTAVAPNLTARQIQVIVNDGSANSSAAISTVAIAAAQIVDTGSPGYSETGAGWYTTARTGYSVHPRADAPGTGSDTATWQVSASGYFTLQATWNPYSDRAPNAAFQIYDGSTLLKTVIVNQTQNPSGNTTVNGWVFQDLAALRFTSGTVKVVLSNNAGGYVVADAVRFAAQPAPVIDLNWTGGGITAPTSTDTASTFTISRTYNISGAAPTSNFTIGYYASTDNVFGNADDFLIGTETISAAAGKTVGTHAGASPALQFPLGGTYYVFAHLDDGNAIPETDKTNNVAQAPQQISVAVASPVIIDNGGAGYSETGTGWYTTARTGYGGNARADAAGNGSDTATWQSGGIPAGSNFTVQATWNPYSDRATNAAFQIFDGTTLLQTVIVNQTQNPAGSTTVNGWVFQNLGTFKFSSGAIKVVLSNNANGYVIADAVRMVSVPAAVIDLNWSGGGITAPTSTDTASTFTISRTYNISGAAPTSNFTIGYYASTDNVFGNADDFLIGTETISAAADKTVGTHAGTSPALQFPIGGTYYVFARLDDGNAILETDKTNNVTQAPQQISVAVASPVIIDNGGPGYSETGSGWYTTARAGYGGNARADAPGNGSDTAAWQAGGFAAGNYTVQATWNPYSDRATNAAFQIYDGTTLLQTVIVNQTQNPAGSTTVNGWVFQNLGTFKFSSGAIKVVLSNNANGYVIADAVRMVSAPTAVIDLNWNGGGITAPASTDTASTFTISRTYNITGAAPTSNFTIGYYASTDNIFGDADDFLLGTETISAAADKTVGAHAGSSPAFQFPIGGTYYVFAHLDDGNAILETDKTNNVAQAPQQISVAVASPVIIDNGGAGYSETGTGWYTTVRPGYGGNARADAPGNGSDTAAWQSGGFASGVNVTVQATWNPYTDRATNAAFQIYDGTTLLKTVIVDQTQNPTGSTTINGWVFADLATLRFTSGTVRVVLSNNANGYVIADALRLAIV